MVAQIVGLFYRQRCVTYMSPSSVVFFESEIPDRHCSTKVLWSWCVSLAHTQSQRIFGTWIWHLQTNQQLGSSNCFGLYIAHFSANTMYEPLKKDLEILPFRWGSRRCEKTHGNLPGVCLPWWGNLSDLSQKAPPLRSKLPPFSDISAVPLTKWQVIRNQHFDKQQNREVLEGHDVCFFNTPF